MFDCPYYERKEDCRLKETEQHPFRRKINWINSLDQEQKLIEKHKSCSQDYSQEELVAEMGAAYLCYMTGIQNATIDNSAAYIKSWIGKFKEDKKILLMACSMAQKAVDYILEHQAYPNPAASVAMVEQLAEAV